MNHLNMARRADIVLINKKERQLDIPCILKIQWTSECKHAIVIF